MTSMRITVTGPPSDSSTLTLQSSLSLEAQLHALIRESHRTHNAALLRQLTAGSGNDDDEGGGEAVLSVTRDAKGHWSVADVRPHSLLTPVPTLPPLVANVLQHFAAPTVSLKRSLRRFVPVAARADVLASLTPLALDAMTPAATGAAAAAAAAAGPTILSSSSSHTTASLAGADSTPDDDADGPSLRVSAPARRPTATTAMTTELSVSGSSSPASGSPLMPRRGSNPAIVLGRGRQQAAADRGMLQPFDSLLLERLQAESPSEHAAFVDGLRAQRVSLLRLTQPSYRWIDPEDYLCRRKRTALWRDAPYQLIEITVSHFAVAIGEWEPLFCRMALYDLRAKRKLTEDFCFDFNSDAVKFFMGDHQQATPDAATTARTVVFPVFDAHPDVYVVFSVEKVLQGADDDVHKPYVEIENAKFKKNMVKYTDRMKDACNTFSQFRQHFCVAALPLFSGPNQFSFGRGQPLKEFYTAPVTDEASLYDMLASVAAGAKNSKFKRGRPLPALCDMSARIVKDDGTADERWSEAARLDAADNVLARAPLPYVPASDASPPSSSAAESAGESQARKKKTLKRSAAKQAAAAAAAASDGDEWGISAAPAGDENANVVVSNDLIKMALSFDERSSFKPHWRYQDLLYVRPQALTARKLYGRNIAIAVRLRSDDLDPSDASADELCFFARSTGPRLKRVAYTRVTWHAKQLVFQDEIKLQLPLTLTPNHHLLFTLIELDEKKKGTADVETVVGWAFYSLRELDGSLRDPRLALTVVDGPLPAQHYLDPSAFGSFKFFEGQDKPCLSVALDYFTTVRTFDAPLARFLSLPRGTENAKRVIDVLESLSNAAPRECVRFFPVLANSLLSLMCAANDAVSAAAFRALLRAFGSVAAYTAANGDSVSAATERERSSFLTSWIDHLLEQPSGPEVVTTLHEALLTALTAFFGEQVANKAVAVDAAAVEMLRFCWALLDMMHKSIALFLDGKGLLGSDDRTKLVPQSLYDRLAKLLGVLLTYVLERIDVLPFSVVRQANAYVALFLRELLLLLDRGAVLGLAAAYVDRIAIAPSDEESRQASKAYLRIEFLHVFSDTEMHVPLLLPSGAALPLDADAASVAHPLAGLLARSVLLTLRQVRNHSARQAAITMLAEKFGKLDNDERFQADETQTLVAVAYFVVVLYLCEQWRELAEWRAHANLLERRALYTLALYTFAQAPSALVVEWLDRVPSARLLALGELLADCVDAFATTPSDRAAAPLGVHLSMQLLLDSLPLRGGDDRQSMLLLSAATTFQHDAASSGELSPRHVISLAPATPEKSSTTDDLPAPVSTRLSPSPKPEAAAAATLRPRRAAPEVTVVASSPESASRRRRAAGGTGSGGDGVLSKRRPDKQQRERSDSWSTSHRPAAALPGGEDGGEAEPVKGTVPVEQRAVQLARNISLQAYLCVLELSERLLSVRGTLADEDAHGRPRRRRLGAQVEAEVPAIALCAYRLQVKLAGKMIPALLAQPLVRSLEHFLATHAPLFFGGADASACNDWCSAFVRYLSGFTPQLRQEATCALFLLLRDDQRFTGQLGRGGTQMTMALSIFAASPAFASADKQHLQQCLLTLSSYAMHEFALPSTTLTPSVRLRADEVERAALVAKSDFAHRVHGLQSTLIGILNDTSKLLHMRATSDAESTQELMWMIARGYSSTPDLRHAWLDMLADEHAARGNWAEAGMCAVNAALLVSLHMRARDGAAAPVQIDVLRAMGGTEALPADGARDACTTAAFTVDGLATTLKRAINFMTQADCFEFAVQLTKALLPIYEQRRQYQALALMHKNNAGLLKQIVDLSIQRSRHLGRYFRVGLYGSKFGAVSGSEFIYREPKLTHLFAFADRLREAFARRFEIDADDITIVKDSNRVTNVDHEKCSVQLTLVKPYFDADELAVRKGYFELRTNVRRFVFLTPFTKDGGASYGGVGQQWVRKTVLTTETTFPGLLKRYRVIATNQFEQTPLDVGLEQIRKRNQLLNEELDLSPPNIKSLQAALQGSVLLQVNEGPVEVCRVFLGAHAEQSYPLATLRQLDAAFRSFLDLCKQALMRNEALIGPDQQAFHSELEQGFLRTATSIRGFLLPEALLVDDEHPLSPADSGDVASLNASSSSNPLKPVRSEGTLSRPRSRAPSPTRAAPPLEMRSSSLALHASVDEIADEGAAGDGSGDEQSDDDAAAAAAAAATAAASDVASLKKKPSKKKAKKKATLDATK
jgi:hypothetical protein